MSVADLVQARSNLTLRFGFQKGQLMARMYPPRFPHVGNKMRNAERVFYDACTAQLDNTWTVLYDVQWFGRRNQGNERGDADFLLMNSEHGLFCVEVKGGQQIFIKDNQWFTVPHGFTEAVKIRDPYIQAAESKSVLWNFLKDNLPEIRLAGALGHFVVLPGVSMQGDISLSARKSLTCDRDSLRNLEQTITQIARVLGQRNSFTETQIERIRELIFPSCELISEFRIRVNEARSFIDEMTTQQLEAFSMLTNFRELKVLGGAGTGKTSLALYRARQLAAQGAHVLYLCNSFTAVEYLRGILSEETSGKLVVESVESFYGQVFHSHSSLKVLSENLTYQSHLVAINNDSEYVKLLSEAWLECAIEGQLFFDALVIDEGQNIPLQIVELMSSLLPNTGTRYVYIFGDRNQNIYLHKDTAMDFEMENPDVLLSTNCRSTAEIVSAAEYLIGNKKNVVGALGVPPVLFFHPKFREVNTEEFSDHELLQSPSQKVVVEAVKYLVESVGLGLDAEIQHITISGPKMKGEYLTSAVKPQAEFGSIIDVSDWSHSPSEGPIRDQAKSFFLKKRTTLPQMVGLEVDGLVIELGGGMVSYGMFELHRDFGDSNFSEWLEFLEVLLNSWAAARDGDSQIDFSPVQIASRSESWSKILDSYRRTIYSTMTRARFAVIFVGSAFDLTIIRSIFGDRCKEIFIEPT